MRNFRVWFSVSDLLLSTVDINHMRYSLKERDENESADNASKSSQDETQNDESELSHATTIVGSGWRYFFYTFRAYGVHEFTGDEDAGG